MSINNVLSQRSWRWASCIVDFDWLKVWVELVCGLRQASCIMDVEWLKVWVGLLGGYRP